MSSETVRFLVEKLVRDRVPLVTGDDRVLIQTKPLDKDRDYLLALKDKLHEEAREVKDAKHDELIDELADVKEVMEEIMKLNHISHKQLELAQQEKRRLRGGFNERLFITTLEAPKDSKAHEYCIKHPKKYPIIPDQ